MIVDDVLRQGIQGISELITEPGPDQPRLRRREDDHVRGGLGADGDRPRHRREPRGRRGAAWRSPARCSTCRMEGARGVLFNITGGARPDPATRSTRPPRSSARRPTPRRTSSSARSSTRGCRTRSRSPSSPPASTTRNGPRARASARRLERPPLALVGPRRGAALRRIEGAAPALPRQSARRGGDRTAQPPADDEPRVATG